MRTLVLITILCLAPLAARADDDGTTIPAPVPSVLPDGTQSDEVTMTPDRIAPVTPGAVDDAPAERDAGNRDRDAPESSVPPSR